MKIENLNLDKKNNKLSFILKDSTEAFANVIRCFAMDEVPVLAIEEVEFHDNSSALYDEIVAHRLGLMPIKTDLKSYDLPEECSCKGAGCAKCQLKIILKTGKRGIVTASDAQSKDPKCKFVYPDMPVVKLLAKQKLELVATAVLGQGKNHAKYSPGLVFYKHEPSIKFDASKLKNEDKQALVRIDKNVFQLAGNKIKINHEALLQSLNYEACIESLEKLGAQIENINNFVFHVESWGQLDPKQILDTAADMLINRLDELAKLLK
ncbi:MAG: DNA-directed RNA polymerase subunit D [Nanoarchaeota archaeon]|nr:DNA-directed RNA polymerase subunit D [Nanoarchaeota archaeon]